MYKSIDEYITKNKKNLIKLHLGCGSKYWDSWCNIDGFPHNNSDTHRGNMEKDPDVWADITNINLKNNSVDIISSQHVMEHFYRYEVLDMFKNFYNILKPGGVIITEMPNLSGIFKLFYLLPIRPKYNIRNSNRDMITAQLYGPAWEVNDKGYPYHKYVWEKEEFLKSLRDIGFMIVLSTGATKSHIPFRDMAIICQKPIYKNNNSLSELSLYWKKNYGSKNERIIIQFKSILKLFFNAISQTSIFKSIFVNKLNLKI